MARQGLVAGTYRNRDHLVGKVTLRRIWRKQSVIIRSSNQRRFAAFRSGRAEPESCGALARRGIEAAAMGGVAVARAETTAGGIIGRCANGERGDFCGGRAAGRCPGPGLPLPVVKTKQALDKLAAGKVFTIVDSPVARDNVIKLAQSLSLPVDVVAEGTDFILSIIKGGGVAVAEPETEAEAAILPEPAGDKIVVLVLADKIGRPEAELGEALTKSFYALTECSPLPRTVIL